MIKGWQEYNHALLPSTPPHAEPNIRGLEERQIWGYNKILLIRYTTEFDCGYETGWWWLIKDDEMDISKLKKKRRYEIVSGLNNCNVKRISPQDYAEQIYSVYIAAFESYQKAGKPIGKTNFISRCIKHNSDSQIEYYGVFDKESGDLAGYALNSVFEDYVNFLTMKFVPKYLAKKASAALIYTMLCDYLNSGKKKYVNDGERSIRHITNFQDYLVKYFGFRRAYCKLHVRYRPSVSIAIKLLYPFRRILKGTPNNWVLNNVSALLKMEEIRKGFKKDSNEMAGNEL